MICNLQTEALPSKKMKRSNWNVNYCIYNYIYSIALISRHMMRTKVLNKILVLKEWLKPMENEVDSILLMENGVTVPPVPSMPISAYTQILIKHISRP